jgi:hypothetical protein
LEGYGSSQPRLNEVHIAQHGAEGPTALQASLNIGR